MTDFQTSLKGARDAEAPPKICSKNLTAREKDILNLVKEGMTNKEIAAARNLTVGTVKVYISNIFFKLGVRGQPGARGQMRMQVLRDYLSNLPRLDCTKCAFRGFANQIYELVRQLLTNEG